MGQLDGMEDGENCDIVEMGENGKDGNGLEIDI